MRSEIIFSFSSVLIAGLVLGPTSVLFLLYYRNIGLFSEESSVLPLVDDIEVGVRYFGGLNALSFFFLD